MTSRELRQLADDIDAGRARIASVNYTFEDKEYLLGIDVEGRPMRRRDEKMIRIEATYFGPVEVLVTTANERVWADDNSPLADRERSGR